MSSSLANLSFSTITCQVEGPVARLTINRPQALNALSTQVISELTSAVEAIGRQSTNEIRIVILQGAGDKAFIAGADIAEMRGLDSSGAHAFAQRGQRLSQLLEALPQVTIAKVQGFALGGGCEMAMACDLIIASNKAKFGQPEVGLGLIPGFGGTQRLVARVGLSVGLDILTTGRTLGGEEAQTLGLVSRAVPPEELDAEVNKVVKGILKSAPQAIAATKRIARAAAYENSLAAGLAAEADGFAGCFSAAEGPEGMAAFLEKRRASFNLT